MVVYLELRKRLKEFLGAVDHAVRNTARGFPYTCSSDFFKNLFRLVLWCPSDVFARTGVEN
jgi:hypothetical protein